MFKRKTIQGTDWYCSLGMLPSQIVAQVQFNLQ